MSSTPADAPGHPPFVQAEYREGVLDSTPLDCPFGEQGEPCAISRHSLRDRKTGPPHPLVILHCDVHERFFTVYPPAFTPYARRQLIEGPVLHEEPSLVEVVNEAALHGPVVRETPDSLSWSTQSHLLERVSALFGLHDPARRPTVSARFGLPLLQLETAAQTHGVRDRGRALQGLLRGLDEEALLGLGALAGLWGPSHRWCPSRSRLLAMGPSP